MSDFPSKKIFMHYNMMRKLILYLLFLCLGLRRVVGLLWRRLKPSIHSHFVPGFVVHLPGAMTNVI